MKQLKKQKKNIKSVLLLLFVLTISSCARVKIKNTEWCGDKGRLGASCFNTLTSETRDVDLAEWDEMRFGMICTNADDFAHWVATLKKLCYLTKRCSYDTKKKIKSFEQKLQANRKKVSDEKSNRRF